MIYLAEERHWIHGVPEDTLIGVYDTSERAKSACEQFEAQTSTDALDWLVDVFEPTNRDYTRAKGAGNRNYYIWEIDLNEDYALLLQRFSV